MHGYILGKFYISSATVVGMAIAGVFFIIAMVFVWILLSNPPKAHYTNAQTCFQDFLDQSRPNLLAYCQNIKKSECNLDQFSEEEWLGLAEAFDEEWTKCQK